MHSEDWQFDDHDVRSEQSGISYTTSVYSEETVGTHSSQLGGGRKTKRFKKIDPVQLTQGQLDHLDRQNGQNKTRGSLQRTSSKILPLDKQDTVRGPDIPISGPSLFAKESFGEEKLKKKLSLGGVLAKQISQSKIRESFEMDPRHISMV